jgi:WD40 repeat protein
MSISITEFKEILEHKGQISKIAIFPNGNFVSISGDKSILLFDNNYNLIGKIEHAHDSYITDIYIENNDNFITCSADLSIKFWKKINNNFICKNKINNAQEYSLIKILVINSNLLITCGDDKIKIYNKNFLNEQFQLMTIISNNNYLNSFLILLDKDILIIIGEEGTLFYKFSTLNFINKINDVSCGGKNAIDRIDNERIIVGGRGDKIMKIVSLNKMRIIKELKNDFFTMGISVIKNKKAVITGGYTGKINIFSSDTYRKIFYINNAHLHTISGFLILGDDDFVMSYSWDKKIKIWKIE